MADKLLIRVFTHPACSGCGPALRMVWEMVEQEKDAFNLRTVKLENKEGLQEAYREGIKTIPTIILSGEGKELERIVGSPSREELAAFKSHLKR